MSRTRVLIAVPVLNEEKILRNSILQIRAATEELLPDRDVTIVIADNASTDDTEIIGREIARSVSGVSYLRLPERGKGRAIQAAWNLADADVYAFMDADLATDLQALPELVGRIESGAAASCGSRVLRGSYSERTFTRRMISLGYRALLWLVLDARLTDAPCGFKAFSADAVHSVMPRVSNQTWFFDSELVFRVARSGAKVVEIPVTWRDNRPTGSVSKVNVFKVAWEYLREVLRLRREVGIEESGPFDLRLWAVVSILLIVITSVAPVYGWWQGVLNGMEYTGRQTFAPGDTAAYLSYISQARDGRFFLNNLATTDLTIDAPNPVWWLAGQLARLPGVTTLLAYHLMRLALIPVLVAVFMRAIAWFTTDSTARRAALLLTCFASGLGALLAPLFSAPKVYLNSMEWPIDLWVAEATPFASMYYSPHFAASWTLLILALFLMSRALDRRSLRDAMLSGASAFLLLSFHPFYVVTYAAISIFWCGFHIVRSGWDSRRAATLVTAGIICAPMVVYQAWLAWFTPNAGFMVDSNILPTPSLLLVATGFGGLLLLAIPGAVLATSKAGSRRVREIELVIWAAVTFVFIYSNVSFERRLVEGLHLPLSVLAAVSLVRLKNVIAPAAYVAVFFFLSFIFLLSPFQIIARDLEKYSSLYQDAYLSAEQKSSTDWIRIETVPDATFMSSFRSGQMIFGWGERRVFAGHWAMTPKSAEKSRMIKAFYSTMGQEERSAFMARNEISHAYFGPEEQAIGTALLADPSMEPVYKTGDVVIFRRH